MRDPEEKGVADGGDERDGGAEDRGRVAFRGCPQLTSHAPAGNLQLTHYKRMFVVVVSDDFASCLWSYWSYKIIYWSLTMDTKDMMAHKIPAPLRRAADERKDQAGCGATMIRGSLAAFRLRLRV